MSNNRIGRILILSAVVGGASAAQAGSIQANYSFAMWQNVNFTWNGNESNGQGTVQFQATRTGGTDTLVPANFIAYCVELTEHIGGGGNTHPNVVPLLGSTTQTGGVVFDATRTKNLQLLWGNAFSQIGGDSMKSAAFQLAEWEICFDDDLSLIGVATPFLVKPGQFQAGITDVAENWLADIRGGNWTQEQSLALLSGQGIQDLVTPVPEPATLGVMAVGALTLIRRKRK